MPDLTTLPLRVLDLATRPTRFVLGRLLALRHAEDDRVELADDEPRGSRPEPAQTAPARKPRAPRPSAGTKRFERREPTRGEVGRVRQAEHMAEQEAGGPGPGATIEVAEPWQGYDAMTEDQVLDRLTGADPALRAITRLYESTHGGRRQILIATEEQLRPTLTQR